MKIQNCENKILKKSKIKKMLNCVNLKFTYQLSNCEREKTNISVKWILWKYFIMKVLIWENNWLWKYQIVN